jgi:hypothetical protein
MLSSRPEIVEYVLGDPRTFAAIFGEARESFLRASPFCIFRLAFL